MSISERIKIFIVEDHDMFREGLRFVFNSNSKYEIIGEAANGKLFLERLDDENLPDVVLMDIDMPVMNGYVATQKALEMYPDMNIITLSMHGDDGHYNKMIEAGVKGFVLKNAGIVQLSEAIDNVVQGNVYFSQELLMNIILKKNSSNEKDDILGQLDISPREMDVLNLICKGYSNKQIADQLFISIKTVEGHKSKLMFKTDTKNAVSLVLFAIKNQLVEI